jgi:hypothetical protein
MLVVVAVLHTRTFTHQEMVAQVVVVMLFRAQRRALAEQEQ